MSLECEDEYIQITPIPQKYIGVYTNHPNTTEYIDHNKPMHLQTTIMP